MKIETMYNKGDIVIFEKNGMLLCGIIEGYYVDHSAGSSIWYNIRTSENNVFTYGNGGDVAEWDIIGTVNSESDLFKSCKEKILGINIDINGSVIPIRSSILNKKDKNEM